MNVKFVRDTKVGDVVECFGFVYRVAAKNGEHDSTICHGREQSEQERRLAPILLANEAECRVLPPERFLSD